MKQTTAKLVDVVYFLMKIKREDELIALINFVSRRDRLNENELLPSRSWCFARPKIGLWVCVQWVPKRTQMRAVRV